MACAGCSCCGNTEQDASPPILPGYPRRIAADLRSPGGFTRRTSNSYAVSGIDIRSENQHRDSATMPLIAWAGSAIAGRGTALATRDLEENARPASTKDARNSVASRRNRRAIAGRELVR